MIIKKIEINKDNVKVLLDDKTFFVISVEAYLNNKILLGEEIDSSSINKLVKSSEIELIRYELLKKITRKKLSRLECESFLLDHNIDKESVSKIIGDFEKNYLISDKELGELIIDNCLFYKRGISKIYQKLDERKLDINKDLLIKEYLDKEKYEKNIKFLIEKYTKLSKNKSRVLLKKYLIAKMVENGYNIEEFVPYIQLEEINEKEILTKEISKFFLTRDINEENIAKITKKLLSKGFNYAIIKEAIRECELYETY